MCAFTGNEAISLQLAALIGAKGEDETESRNSAIAKEAYEKVDQAFQHAIQLVGRHAASEMFRKVLSENGTSVSTKRGRPKGKLLYDDSDVLLGVYDDYVALGEVPVERIVSTIAKFACEKFGRRFGNSESAIQERLRVLLRERDRKIEASLRESSIIGGAGAQPPEVLASYIARKRTKPPKKNSG